MTTANLTSINRSERSTRTSPLVYARSAGVLYLLVAVLGAFGMIYVPAALFVPGDDAATLANIAGSEGLFRLGIVSSLLTQVVQILLVLVLYKLLAPVNKNHAVLMVTFILLGVPIAMLNELNHVAPLLLLDGGGFGAEWVQALAPFFLELHKHGIMIDHIFWGLWLFPMGYLVFKSGFIPKIIGILLMIGCFGYLADFATYFLFPGFGVSVSEFTFVGELLLPLWLVFRGVNVEGWEKWALVAART